MSQKYKCYQKLNIHKTEMSTKLKRHENWNVTKLTFHQSWNVTKTEMSHVSKTFCHQNWYVTKTLAIFSNLPGSLAILGDIWRYLAIFGNLWWYLMTGLVLYMTEIVINMTGCDTDVDDESNGIDFWQTDLILLCCVLENWLNKIQIAVLGCILNVMQLMDSLWLDNSLNQRSREGWKCLEIPGHLWKRIEITWIY